ncbi:helix-turn-helix domain-containing protein [Amycolatopsis minnesotensis]|uniref:Helix-turn-helix domain-containing protein n=1 Tax=Amycolatopsis minnesotensis TaxID=337894 RepID=A0ABP5CES7_9PSEU
MSDDPWPWPGDSPLDRARRVARTYREALLRDAPETCAELDDRCRELGQSWVVPKPLTFGQDDLLDADEVADMCDVRPGTVRQWRRRGLPTVDTVDGVRYRVADVLAYHADRRIRRANMAVNPDMTRDS